MSELILKSTYGPRDDEQFLREMNMITEHHIRGCPEFSNIWRGWQRATKIEDLPYLHVGLFKKLDLKTESAEVSHERTLQSSSTSGVSSKIHLDSFSSQLQSKSSNLILKDFLGDGKAPLLILDTAKSLRQRGVVSAKIAAAMSLREFATDMIFLLKDENAESMKEEMLESVLTEHDTVLVYGFSWMLWFAWGKRTFSKSTRELLAGKTIKFIHSGGWKKLEAEQVSPKVFESTLLDGLGENSLVLDYYGLVEQIGIIYPLCEAGWRHVPLWANVIVRDSYSLEPLIDKVGQLQLLNAISWGAPYHNVLTEDIGLVSDSPCNCGRSGKKFQLLGRIPKSEVRGCSNV